MHRFRAADPGLDAGVIDEALLASAEVIAEEPRVLAHLRGISPPEMTLKHMFTGIVPFILLRPATLAIVAYCPPSVRWVPAKLRES